MGRSQRDEPSEPAITDVSVTGTYATDDTPIETAINHLIDAMEDAGVILRS